MLLHAPLCGRRVPGSVLLFIHYCINYHIANGSRARTENLVPKRESDLEPLSWPQRAVHLSSPRPKAICIVSVCL